MREEFLAAVQIGNVKEAQTLIKDNASLFSICYYIRGRISKIQNSEANNLLTLNPATPSPSPDIKNVIIINAEGALTKNKLEQSIIPILKTLKNIPKELAYTSWALLDETQLDKATINTALLMAAQNGNVQTLELLLLGGFQATTLTLLNGSADKIKANPYFKKYFKCPTYQFNFSKADPNVQNEQGETALQLAAKSGSIPCVMLLLANGAKIPENDTPTIDKCKEAIKDQLKSCGKEETSKLKAKFEKYFPDLFPPPKWYLLMLYAQKLMSNLMAHRFVEPIFTPIIARLTQAFYTARGVVGITTNAPTLTPPPQLAYKPPGTAAKSKGADTEPVSLNRDENRPPLKRRASI